MDAYGVAFRLGGVNIPCIPGIYGVGPGLRGQRELAGGAAGRLRVRTPPAYGLFLVFGDSRLGRVGPFRNQAPS